MNYTVYRIDTGQIVKTVICSAENIGLQFDKSTHKYLEGTFSDAEYYVVRGQPVAKLPPPSQHHVFDYATKQWIDPRTPETEWSLVRAERDRRLLASDWTQLPDVPLATKEAWAAYRQALRDITLQPDPFNITWPAAPDQGGQAG